MRFAARVSNSAGRRVLMALALGLIAIAAVAVVRRSAPVEPAASSSPKAERPEANVILIVIDTLRSDQLSCYADTAPPTPHIDQLAADGALFENAYSAAPWTAPSLVSIMTGVYPSTHGVLAYPSPAVMDDDRVTLAEALKARGYATAAFTEGGFAKPSFGLGQGFDHYPTYEGDNETYFGNLLSGSRLDENVARALSWLTQNASEPFFLFFHTYAPHYPYNPPPHLLERPVDLPPDAADQVRSICERANAGAAISDLDTALVVRNLLRVGEFQLAIPHSLRCMQLVRRAVERPSKTVREAIDDLRVLYRASVRNADQAVGQILAKLDELGIDDRTVVLLTSDHGEGLGDHGHMQHGTNLHRELLRVPLLLRTPDRQFAGRRVAQLVRTIDIAPTLIEVMDASPLVGCEGRSLLPLLAASPVPERTALSEAISIANRERNMRALRTSEWALIHDRGGIEALYRTQTDPLEQTNVAALHPDVRERLRGQLLETSAGVAQPPSGDHQAPALNEQELRSLGYAQ